MYDFCTNIRRSYGHPEKNRRKKFNQEHIDILDSIGFSLKSYESYETRMSVPELEQTARDEQDNHDQPITKENQE